MRKLITFCIASLLSLAVSASNEGIDHRFSCNYTVEDSADGENRYYPRKLLLSVKGETAVLTFGADDRITGMYTWNQASSKTPEYTGSVWNVHHYNKESNGVEVLTSYAFNRVSPDALYTKEDGTMGIINTVKLAKVTTNLTKDLIVRAETFVLAQCETYYKPL
ncbi:hypothetical protein [Shewanella waksmanii]|uniref:hypothetical protein n=1 Tax=Shewanella waksmanii TaxID=213783 RepID=UPI00048D08E3|nr:hypothetical protein [Shewanella waksmanii]